jgi:hypothetical protein
MQQEESLDLSEKSIVELNDLYAVFHMKKATLHTEKTKLEKDTLFINKKIKYVDDNLTNILKEILRHKDIEESKHMINDKIKSIDDFELLSEREIAVITTKMDKTDYRHYGKYPRWLDLERIIKEIIDIKKRYPAWTLKKMAKEGEDYAIPPKNVYIYEFTDEYNTVLNVGSARVS